MIKLSSESKANEEIRRLMKFATEFFLIHGADREKEEIPKVLSTILLD